MLSPFYLRQLCERGETIEEMGKRVCANILLERICTALDEGRDILGLEEIGIRLFDKSVFDAFRKSVCLDNMFSTHKSVPVTDQFICGEYRFDYNGREFDAF